MLNISAEEVKSVVKRLKDDYMMTQRDIAKWCGVNQPVVTWWINGDHKIKPENFDRLREAVVLLAGRNIRYKGQALDVLRGEE